MSLSMLFQQWFEAEYVGSEEAVFEFVKNPGSAYLDIDTDTTIARITLWDVGITVSDVGFCDMESWVIERSERISWKHHEFTKWEEIEPVIAAFMKTTLEQPHGI